MKIEILYERHLSNHVYIKQCINHDDWLVKLYHREFDKEKYHNERECCQW